LCALLLVALTLALLPRARSLQSAIHPRLQTRVFGKHSKRGGVVLVAVKRACDYRSFIPERASGATAFDPRPERESPASLLLRAPPSTIRELV
jgi:hypothetical protein